MTISNFEAPHKVVALVYDGLCSFEYGIVAEVFGLKRPELGRELYHFASVALDGGVLRAAGGLEFSATGSVDDLAQAQTIVIPGWRGCDAPVPKVMIEQIRLAHQRGARLLSICSGVYVLAAAGLLNGVNVTTHWRYAQDLKAKYPQLNVDAKQLYIEQGNIVTSAGSSAGIDACMHLVRSDYGEQVANSVARRLVIHAHRQGSQAQFIEQPMPKLHKAHRLSGLMQRVKNNLSSHWTIHSMATLAHMSERTFQRQFVAYTGLTAMKWVVQQRVVMACRLLESSDLDIEQIAHEVGFNDVASLRYHFNNQLELSPTQYRKRFVQNACV